MKRSSSTEAASRRKALEHAAWMNQPPNPLPVFRRGSPVQVYRGAGWSAGSVVQSGPNGCVVKLNQTREDVRVYDARCIRPVSQKDV